MRSLNFKFDVDRAARAQEEAHVRDAFADDDRVGVGEVPSVDVHREIPGRQARERTMHAALKFVVRRARADRFPHGERDQLADAKGCGEREGDRAARGDCMEIERNPHANHKVFFLR